MMIPKKLLPNCLAVAALAILASASALAASPAQGRASPLPKTAGQVPQYMIAAAGLDNRAFMDCVKASMKQPAEKHIVQDVAAAIQCSGSTN